MSFSGKTVTFDQNAERMVFDHKSSNSGKGSRDRFKLSEFDPTPFVVSKKDGLLENAENQLKSELLQIFMREKEAMEMQYANKVQELLRGFKNKKGEWEQIVKDEREFLEQELENEKSEIHQKFAQEMSKMIRNCETEKIEVEKNYETKINELEKLYDERTRKENERHQREKEEIKKELKLAYDSNLKFSWTKMNQSGSTS